MIEKLGNIWSHDFDGYWRVIPINCQVDNRGFLIMGAGLAKEAAERYPGLALIWGSNIKKWLRLEDFNLTYTFGIASKLYAIPTKYHYKENANLELIEKGLRILKKFHITPPSFSPTICPRLGCGLGRLDWDLHVKPLVEKYFGDDDNFIVVHL